MNTIFLNIFFFVFFSKEWKHGEELETYKHQLPEKKKKETQQKHIFERVGMGFFFSLFFRNTFKKGILRSQSLE